VQAAAARQPAVLRLERPRVYPVGQPGRFGGPAQPPPVGRSHRTRLHQPRRRGKAVQVHDPIPSAGSVKM
jgi:hypothetical protein